MSDRRHVVGRHRDADFTDWYTVDAANRKRYSGAGRYNDILSASNVCRCSSIMLEFLPRQKAIILGSFSGSTPTIMTQVTTWSQCTRFCVPACRSPLITGLDFGHEPRTVTLPLGAQAILTNTREGTQLTISGHPVLKCKKSRFRLAKRCLCQYGRVYIRDSVIRSNRIVGCHNNN